MRSDEHVNLLALCRIKDLNWHLVAREAGRPDGLSRLLQGRFTERSKIVDEARALIEAARSRFPALRDEVQEILRTADRDQIRLTTVLDEDYPLNLRMIFNLPPFLFYRGELRAEEDARSVAVVGTREATPAGLAEAATMAGLLAEHGVTVLSGLARGIDTQAHRATLDAGGRTVAVLGSGLRRVYPPENVELAREIAETGAVVSQFWPDSPPARHTFPRRNVTMSGMGQGTVVIEASHRSGAKLQARLALEHGKKVFLIKDLVTKQAWARRYVQERGAIEVGRVQDILERLRTPEDIRARTQRVRQLSLGFA